MIRFAVPCSSRQKKILDFSSSNIKVVVSGECTTDREPAINVAEPFSLEDETARVTEGSSRTALVISRDFVESGVKVQIIVPKKGCVR